MKTASRRFDAGAASLALPTTLAAGAYRVSAVATDDAGNPSAPVNRPLKVVNTARP